MRDASYYDILELQDELKRSGIDKSELDLDNYAGLTRRELESIVRSAIYNKVKKEVNKKWGLNTK